jgi:hypothetical protein
MAAKSPKKSVLFTGIGLLVFGIVLRSASSYPLAGLLLIFLGVSFKTYYIIAAIRSGLYKPGKELWFLFIGLTCFLTGLYLRRNSFDVVNPIYLILFGLSLKILFILRFIQLVRIERANQDQ